MLKIAGFLQLATIQPLAEVDKCSEQWNGQLLIFSIFFNVCTDSNHMY